MRRSGAIAIFLLTALVAAAGAAMFDGQQPAPSPDPKAAGGPDAYGYRFFDSDSPDTAAYRWVDTTGGTWTAVTNLGDDNVVGPFALGFEFPYYWYRVSQFWIHANGGISFSLPSRAWTPHNPGDEGFPNLAQPQDLIGACGLDLDFTAGGRCRYRVRAAPPESLVVSWLGVPRWSTGDLYSFQLVLARADSTIRVLIRDVTNPPNNLGSLGIENSGGNIGLTYFSNGTPPQNRLHDLLAIKYRPPATSTYTATDGGVVAALNTQSGAVVQHTGDALRPWAIVKNFGTTNIATLKAVCRIRNGAGAMVFADSLLDLAIPKGQQLPVTFANSFTPSVTGTYRLVVRTYLAENPVNTANDSMVVELPVVTYQSWIAYDDDSRDAWGSWSGTGPSNPTGFGNHFTVSRYPAAIDSVSLYINHAAGNVLWVEIRDTTGEMGGPGALLSADTVTFTTTAIEWVTLGYTARNLVSDNGKFFVCYRTPSAGLKVGLDESVPVSRRTWEYAGGWTLYRSMETRDAMIRVNCRSAALGACYVDAAAGDDANPGSSSAPYRTISRALARIAATATDTAYVRSGSYAERIDILPAHSGTAAFRTVIAAQPGHAPVIDPPAGSAYALADSAGSYVTITGLTIQPGDSQMAAVVFNGSNVEFINNTVYAPTMGPALLVMGQSSSSFRGNTVGPVSDNAYPGQGIWAYLTDSLAVDSNVVTGMIDAGILVWGCSNTSVTRNLVDQCHLGVSFEGTSGGALYNNTIDNNTNSGVYVAGLSGTLTARNNNITSNAYGFCWVDSAGSVSSDYNNVWGNTWNYQDPQGPGDTNTVAAGAHDLSADPLYDGARHLQAGSPCINAGTPVGLPYLGIAPDIGAFEDWAKTLAGGGSWIGARDATFGLRQNHPNPFSGRTTISYQLANPGPVRLGIYNIAGQLVRTLVDAVRPAGSQAATWDGRDDRGRAVSAGVYHYRLVCGGGQQVRTLLLVK